MQHSQHNQPPTRSPPATSTEAIAAIYDAHGVALYRYALLLTVRAAVAEDAVQQAFMKLAGMGDRVAELHDPERYMRRAVRNECFRLMNHRMRASVSLEEHPLLQGRPAEDVEQREAIERSLRELPPEQREVVCMKIYEHMTFQQIAELLDISLNTVASRYRYALQKLRLLLASHVEAESRRT